MRSESHQDEEEAAQPPDVGAEQDTGADADPEGETDSNPGQKGTREAPLGGI